MSAREEINKLLEKFENQQEVIDQINAQMMRDDPSIGSLAACTMVSATNHGIRQGLRAALMALEGATGQEIQDRMLGEFDIKTQGIFEDILKDLT